MKKLLDQYKKLLLAGDTSGAEKVLAKINKAIVKMDGSVSEQERQKLEITKKLSKAESRLKAVRTKLGMKDDDEDEAGAITNLSKKGKKGDKADILSLEIEALKGELVEANETIKNSDEKHKKEVLKASMKGDIAELLVKNRAKKGAMKHIAKEIMSIAEYGDDGKISYKNEDGTTMRVDGKDATLKDVVSGMRKAEKDAKESMFFDISPQESGARDKSGGKVDEGDYKP